MAKVPATVMESNIKKYGHWPSLATPAWSRASMPSVSMIVWER